MTVAACDVPTIVVDGKYDVPVVKQHKNGEEVYQAVAIYYKTKNRPPQSIQQSVYIKAIEQYSGCEVIPESVRWVDAGVASNAAMTASVDCE
jgi:hypothetical protein